LLDTRKKLLNSPITYMK